MCRHSSRLNKVGFVVFVLGCVAAGLGFSAPFWVRIPDNMSFTIWDKTTWFGLWATCCTDKSTSTQVTCVWIWDVGYSASDFNLPPCTWVWNVASLKTTSDLPAWYTASQIIYCCALGLLVLGLVIESIYHCCRCCKNPACFPTAVASFALSGALLVGLSLALYGGFSYQEGVFSPYGISGGRGGQLDWSFYVAIAGAGTCLIAAILFFVDGCAQARSYAVYGKYKTPEVAVAQ